MFNKSGNKVVNKFYINIYLPGIGIKMVQTDPNDQDDDGASDEEGEGPGDVGGAGGNRILLRTILGKIEDIAQQNEAISEKLTFWRKMN